MKQIIVITNDKTKYVKDFPERKYFVIWCEFSVEQLQAVREKSNLIVLCMDHEKTDDLKRMGLYLRDLCIEDEKVLYMYGNKEDVDLVKSLVPSLFVEKTLYSFAEFTQIIDEIEKSGVATENGKPVFLIIDEDRDFVEKLRVYLDPFYRVFVSKIDLEEIKKLLFMADTVLISSEGKMRFIEFMELSQILVAKKKVSGFRYYYMAKSGEDQNRINAGYGRNTIAFSKDMEVSRIADYFIKHISGSQG
ncbi:MAG: hypothetical protein K6E49_03845 [Lachnospiraceae bacterium]|nr:hypothetical protein [Lachnospiraceae bacterium]